MAPTKLKRIISAIVTMTTDFQKSRGSFISAIKLGMVIWPMKVKLILRKALIPCMKVVPVAGMRSTIGWPFSTLHWNGCFSMPEKIMPNSRETNVKKAEAVASLDKVPNVLGNENKNDTTLVIKENAIVHIPWPVIVLRYSAPTKQCKP